MSIYAIGFSSAFIFYNYPYDNEITSNCVFGKGIQISAGGTWGTNESTYVKFYNNYVHEYNDGYAD